MVCCALICVHSSFAIILMGKRGLVASLHLSSWCLVIVVRLILAVSWVCLQFVIVLFSDHTHLLFMHAGLFCMFFFVLCESILKINLVFFLKKLYLSQIVK